MAGKLNCKNPHGNGNHAATQPTLTPLETVFFGPHIGSTGSTIKCTAGAGGGCGGGGNSTGVRLAQSRQVHRDICELLLMALESLRENLSVFGAALSAEWQLLAKQTPTEATGANTVQRLRKLADMGKVSGRRTKRYGDNRHK